MDNSGLAYSCMIKENDLQPHEISVCKSFNIVFPVTEILQKGKDCYSAIPLRLYFLPFLTITTLPSIMYFPSFMPLSVSTSATSVVPEPLASSIIVKFFH